MTRRSWRRPHAVARDRRGKVLSLELRPLLLPGEMLAPSQRRILMVLVAEEGKPVRFTELARLAQVGRMNGTRLDQADRLHRHVHYIRRALIDDCWIDSIIGVGFVFRRRLLSDAPRKGRVSLAPEWRGPCAMRC